MAVPGSAGELIDISVPIRPAMPIWPGNRGVTTELASAIVDGAPADVTSLHLGAHTGTHVDAPRHFLPGGAGAETIDPATLTGPCVVADATAATRLDGDAIRALGVPAGTRRVLLQTANSQLWARDDFVADHLRLDASGAEAILEILPAAGGLVGIDYLSIGDEDAHRLLLGAGVVPLEGLDLRDVLPGPYTLICTALLIPGSDGAPARALLAP